MKWYWKVRIFGRMGQYAVTEVETDRVLDDIGTIQDFYKNLTGCKMLLEGMSEKSFETVSLAEAFKIVWER